MDSCSGLKNEIAACELGQSPEEGLIIGMDRQVVMVRRGTGTLAAHSGVFKQGPCNLRRLSDFTTEWELFLSLQEAAAFASM